jgi:hypothetical protein
MIHDQVKYTYLPHVVHVIFRVVYWILLMIPFLILDLIILASVYYTIINNNDKSREIEDTFFMRISNDESTFHNLTLDSLLDKKIIQMERITIILCHISFLVLVVYDSTNFQVNKSSLFKFFF